MKPIVSAAIHLAFAGCFVADKLPETTFIAATMKSRIPDASNNQTPANAEQCGCNLSTSVNEGAVLKRTKHLSNWFPAYKNT